MKKYETSKEKSTAAELVATMPNHSIFLSPGASKPSSGTESAVANAVAEARVRSVHGEVNRGTATSPFSSISRGLPNP